MPVRLIPKGAKNVAVAKEFLKYFIQPKVMQRVPRRPVSAADMPPCRRLVKNDPFWLDPKDPHRKAYVQQGLLGPTVPDYYVYNRRWRRSTHEHVCSVAMIDVMKDGMTPEAAVDKAFKRIEEIFAKYPIKS